MVTGPECDQRQAAMAVHGDGETVAPSRLSRPHKGKSWINEAMEKKIMIREEEEEEERKKKVWRER
ncbi:hypothetical protein DY000_02062219 [Brassica cretica]|uniref:Uncharacterized protein n=1 Tax=Brassica cretica TaxID=69181 RepID=A0ABQ7B2U3_BRACR|nr:hypothetical protein DY000_02062219 [Brassica cretica]